jgi:tight adherence protein C
MDLALVVVAATAVAVLLVAFAATDYYLERRRVYQQLRTMESFDIDPGDVRARQLSAPVRARVIFPGLRRLAEGARRLTPAGVMDRLRQQLVYAGSPAAWDAERVLVVKILLAIALVIVAPVAVASAGVEPFVVFVVGLLGLAVGWFVPEWVLRSRAEKRQREIGRTLPDALDLLSITVEAGLGFDSALTRVSREMGGALGEELYRVVQEMQLGKNRQEALRSLGDRTKVPPLKEFVLAMIQADIFGISIARVLNVQAEEIRLKRRQAVEENAQKIPVKILFPLILCILPATFVVIAGPAILQLVDFFASG